MNYFLVLLLTIHACLLAWVNWATCANRTEAGHIVAAAYFWETQKFDVFHVNPPLTRMITAAPIALCQPEYDWTYYSPKPEDRCEWELGNHFFRKNSAEKSRLVTFAARCSLIPFLLLGGYFGFLLARDLYGEAAGCVFLILWCFSPFLLAWGATVCPDAVAPSLGIVALYFFRQWLLTPTKNSAIIAGVTLGLLPLTKFTWIIAFGIWPLVWIVWRFFPSKHPDAETEAHRPVFAQLCLIGLAAIFAINLGYGFDGTFLPLGKYQFISQTLHGKSAKQQEGDSSDTNLAPFEDQAENKDEIVSGNRFQDTWLSLIPVPLPSEFVQGIDTQKRDFERGLDSYLMGEWSEHGWWYYYIFALLVKMPLGTWTLILLATAYSLCTVKYRATRQEEALLLLPVIIILIFVSSQTGFSANSRYMILVIPIIFVWISKLGRVFTHDGIFMRGMVIAMLCWTSMSSLWVYPHSMAYFNELIGGPANGGRYLLDSNLDWGQNIYYVQKWLKRHPQVEPNAIIYVSVIPREHLGIRTKELPTKYNSTDGQEIPYPYYARYSPIFPGWYLVSASELCGRDQHYEAFHSLPITERMGYSIYIYHITLDDANRVRRELGLPELAEDWEREQEHRATGDR